MGVSNVWRALRLSRIEKSTRDKTIIFARQVNSLDSNTVPALFDQSKEDPKAFDELCQHFEKKMAIYTSDTIKTKNNYDLFKNILGSYRRIEAVSSANELEEADINNIINLATEHHDGGYCRHYEYLVDNLSNQEVARQLHFKVICSKAFTDKKFTPGRVLEGQVLELSKQKSGSKETLVVTYRNFLQELSACQAANDSEIDYCSIPIMTNIISRNSHIGYISHINVDSRIALSAAMILNLQGRHKQKGPQVTVEETEKETGEIIRGLLMREEKSQYPARLIQAIAPHIKPDDQLIAHVLLDYFMLDNPGSMEAAAVLMSPSGLDITNKNVTERLPGFIADNRNDLERFYDEGRERLKVRKDVPVTPDNFALIEPFIDGYNRYYQKNQDKAHLPALCYADMFDEDAPVALVTQSLQQDIVADYEAGKPSKQDKLLFFIESGMKLLMDQRNSFVAIDYLAQVIVAETRCGQQAEIGVPAAAGVVHDSLIARNKEMQERSYEENNGLMTANGKSLSGAATTKLFEAYTQIILDNVDEMLQAPAKQQAQREDIVNSYKRLSS